MARKYLPSKTPQDKLIFLFVHVHMSLKAKVNHVVTPGESVGEVDKVIYAVPFLTNRAVYDWAKD